MAEKLRIDATGVVPGRYGPFYVLCDVLVAQDHEIALVLTRDARGEDHVYKLRADNTMRMTRPDGEVIPGVPLKKQG